MARAKLKRFEIEPEGDGFALRIEDAQGIVHELVVTREQLDLMADLIDDVLLSDEAPGAAR